MESFDVMNSEAPDRISFEPNKVQRQIMLLTIVSVVFLTGSRILSDFQILSPVFSSSLTILGIVAIL